VKGLVIWIRRSPGSDESVLDRLGEEIGSRGGRVEVFHSQALEKLGISDNHQALSAACAMLASHGVIVIAAGDGLSGMDDSDSVAVREISEEELLDGSSHREFMRQLELSGLIPPPKHDVHPDEEKEILERLRKLGYID